MRPLTGAATSCACPAKPKAPALPTWISTRLVPSIRHASVWPAAGATRQAQAERHDATRSLSSATAHLHWSCDLIFDALAPVVKPGRRGDNDWEAESV
jgi:hypothetical protein